MFVKVKIIDSEGNEKGRGYTYESDIDVEIGDKVVADMGGGDKVLKVVSFAEPQDYENVDFEIKKIKSVYTGEADGDGVLSEKSIDIEIVEETLPVIKINFDTLKTELAETLKKYSGLIVTEQSLPGCKATQKTLAGLRIKIDNYRKDKKKELSAPISAFEDQCKELIALVEKAETPIKEGIKVFDDQKKDANRQKAMKIIADVVAEVGLTPEYAARLDVSERYCNLTETEADIKRDVQSRAFALKSEQDRAQEMLDIIKLSIDTENARIKTKLSLADFQRLIDRHMSTVEVHAEIKSRAQRIYDAENRPVEPPKVEEPVVVSEPVAPAAEAEPEQTAFAPVQKYFAVYRITGTASDLMGVSAYLKTSGIEYVVEDQGEL